MEENIREFQGLWLFVQVFSLRNFGGMAYFGSTSKQSVKVFSMKFLFSAEVSCYMVSDFLHHCATLALERDWWGVLQFVI